MISTRILLAFTLASAASTSCGSPHTVAGHKSAELFPDKSARALADAACEGDSAKVAKLAHGGANVNYRGVEGSTPLMWAISCANLVGVRALLGTGANPNQSAEGSTPLMAAAVLADPSILNALLDAGADPNRYPDGSKVNVLRIAVEISMDREDRRVLQTLLDRGADVNFPSEGRSVVQFAASLNRFDEASMMLDHGYKGSLETLSEFAEMSLKQGNLIPQAQQDARDLIAKIDQLQRLSVSAPH